MLWVWSLSISPAVHVSDTLLISTALWVMSRRHCCDKLKELLWDFSASWTHFKSSGKVTTHGCGGGVVRVSAADNGETGLIMCVCNEDHLNKAMCSDPEFLPISRVTMSESLIVPETHSMKQITDKLPRYSMDVFKKFKQRTEGPLLASPRNTGQQCQAASRPTTL